MGTPVHIVWEGRKPIHEVQLDVDSKPFVLPSELIDERDRIWQFLNHFDPDQYNGLLFLVNISPYHSVHFPSLLVQKISYRNFKTLQYSHRNFPPLETDYDLEIDDQKAYMMSGPDEESFRHDIFQNLSVLCCVYLIFNSDRSYILVGRRQEISGWGDGYFACPGGLIEWSRLDNVEKELNMIQNGKTKHFSTGLMNNLMFSELHEEIKSDLSITNTEIVGIIDARNGMFANLVIEVTISDCKLDETIRTNNEFRGSQLDWYPVKSVQNLPDNELFGGLRFLKYSSLY